MEFRKFAVVEKQFDYKGHDCICIFNKNGYRCGYVSVHTDKDYTEYNIDCHGGLTFSGILPYDYGQNYQYYIGFDCGHFEDGIDYNKAFEYGLIGNEEFEYFSSSNLWSLYPAMTLDFVIEQCKHIVDQLERKRKVMKKFEELTRDELKALYDEKVKQEESKKEQLKQEESKKRTTKRWRATIGKEKYWFINSNGVIDYQWDKHSYADDFRYNTGNYFQTKEQAKEYKKKLLLQQAYKDWCAFDCDWNNSTQEKFYAEYFHNEIRIASVNAIKKQGIIYAESRERIQEFIDKIGEEDFKKHILEVE